MNQYQDSQLIAKYLELRTRKAKLEEQQALDRQPLNDAMDMIEGEMSSRLLARGANNSKTDNGTAYRSRVVKYKVTDREAFLGFVRDNELWNLMSVNTLKEGMDEFVESEKALPPGTDATAIESTNFRKA